MFNRAVFYIKNGPKPANDSSNEVKLAYYKCVQPWPNIRKQ